MLVTTITGTFTHPSFTDYQKLFFDSIRIFLMNFQDLMMMIGVGEGRKEMWLLICFLYEATIFNHHESSFFPTKFFFACSSSLHINQFRSASFLSLSHPIHLLNQGKELPFFSVSSLPFNSFKIEWWDKGRSVFRGIINGLDMDPWFDCYFRLKLESRTKQNSNEVMKNERWLLWVGNEEKEEMKRSDSMLEENCVPDHDEEADQPFQHFSPFLRFKY